MTGAALVPELLVTDVQASLGFWCGLCGFVVAYDRPDEGFAYLVREAAEVMLEQRGIGRNWEAAPAERPFGRGMNLQITVADIAPIVQTLAVAEWPLHMAPESTWYRVSGGEEAGVTQFVVADPDGYLLRFQQAIARRPAPPR